MIRLSALVEKRLFTDSATYWRELYARGGNSGPGSYGRLANFKAAVLNDFFSQNSIQSAIEFGCGDGNQLQYLECPSYIGLDVSAEAIALCKEKHGADTSKSFYLYHPDSFVDNHGFFKAQVALSLDVLYHLVEDQIFHHYMTHLFSSASRYVIIYSVNQELPIPFPHVRARRFTDWTDKLEDWQLTNTIKNKFPFTGDPETSSISDFFFFTKLD